MIVKITAIALITIFISSSLKSYNKDFSSFVSIAGGVIIFLFCVDEITNIISYFVEMYELVNFDYEYFSLIFKIIGVGYITEFTADIAEDFGNKTVSSRVVLGGKIIICGMSIPVIKSLLALLSSFLF